MHRSKWYLSFLQLGVLCLSLFTADFAISASGPPVFLPEVTYFQGRVYAGMVGDQSQPLEGATVELWASNNPYPDSGTLWITTTTNVDGWYGLPLPEETIYEYYHIRSKNLPGYASSGATSVDGIVRSDDWIEYSYPLDGLTLTGNKFWDQLTEPTQGSDLQVNGIWAQAGALCYQGWNAGDQSAPAGHITSLSVDGVAVDTHPVESETPAGGTWSACFGLVWSCSPDADLISVQVDSGEVIPESNEDNNALEETLACDTTPPEIIAGPEVLELGSDFVLVGWDTDEDSDSRIRYGDISGELPHETGEAGLVTHHEVLVDGLLPAHTYRYQVESQDASGNSVTSRGMFIRTEALPDGEDPSIILEAQGTLNESALITASVQDNAGVDKVVFIIDGVQVFSDYSEPFSYAFDSRNYANGDHIISAEAFDLSGHQGNDSLPVNVANFQDASAPNVNITAPAQNATVSGITDVKVTISDDTGIVSARFYVDGDYRQFEPFDVSNPPTSSNVTFAWDTRGESNGGYRLAVQAYDLDGKESTATVDVIVNNVAPAPPPSPPWLEVVDQTVLNNQNKFVVLLSVKNTGDAAARNIKIYHGMQGFQPIATQTPVSNITTEADPNAAYTYADIRPTSELAPGETRVFTYNLVPALTAPNSATPSIGYFVDLYWDSATNAGYHDFVQAPVAKTFNGLTIPQAHAQALSSADYLIVTNPYRLFAIYNPTFAQGASPQRTQVNQLLSTMAELAFYKKGVLGYNTTYNSESLRDLIKVGGSWSSKLVPGWTSNGYLLIVGETDIVSAWWRYYGTKYTTRGDLDFITSFSDYPYASTFGDEIRPELNMARIIGNNAYYLRLPIQNSLNLYRGENGYSYDGLLKLAANGFSKCMSGGCDGIYFDQEVDKVVKVLPGPIVGLRTPDLAVYDLEGKIDITATRTAIINTFFANTPNRDVIFLAGHGNGGSWDAITVNAVHNQALPFGNANPFVFASSCSTASYPGGTSLAEAFLNRRAGAYLGAINIGACYENHLCPHADTFFMQWKDNKPISQALRDTKNKIGSGFHDRYWAGIYHVFGDAKFGGPETTETLEAQSPSKAAETSQGPIGPVAVEIPAVEITRYAAYDSAEIPGGQLTMEVGKPAVPFYTVTYEYPSGTQIQDVSMTWRSDPEFYPGLNLITTTLALAGDVVLLPQVTDAPVDIWPEADFEWQVFESPMTTTLMLTIYPFQYDRQQGIAEFTPAYEFEIQAMESQVEIESLNTDRHTYLPGEAVTINLGLQSNAEAPFDGVVQTHIYHAASGEMAAGLPVHTLSSLAGEAGFSAVWDSGASPQDVYSVRVDVLDANGTLLDTSVDTFQVGYREIEPLSLVALPEVIDPGEALTLSLALENSGTLPVTGTVVLEVHSALNGLLDTIELPVVEIQPGETYTASSTWDSHEAPSGKLNVIGYMRFDGLASEVLNREVTITHQLYLPQIES